MHQVYKTYEPVVSEYYEAVSHWRPDYSTNLNFGTIIELVGRYKEYKGHRDYQLSDKKIVAITRKILTEEAVVFNFDSLHDIPIGSRIEIDGQEYVINNKKYQLDGDVDYYIEDRFIKCEDFDEQYEAITKEAKGLLSEKWAIEVDIRKKATEEETEKKKSIWWYFGIR